MTVEISQVAAVLGELRYPAAKWQILVEADHYGTNGPTKAALWALPVAQYHSFDDIRAALIPLRTTASARYPSA